MSTTKEIKTLLQEVRLRLDEESRASVEPVLRRILEASKPQTIKYQYAMDIGQMSELQQTGARED